MSESQNLKENNEVEVEAVKDKKSGASKNNNSLKEVGGPLGLEPTRYGDWERKGRCVDF